MFDTSVDLMYGAIALSILLFTGFVCWMIYYAVQILKQGNEVIADIRQKIVEFEEMLQSIKDKVMTSASSISFIANEIGTIVDIVKGMKGKKSRSGKKTKTVEVEIDEDDE